MATEPDDDLVLWRLGDEWGDVRALIERADGIATVVSVHGSARIFDLREGLHFRVPLEGGRRLLGDGAWRRLIALEGTSCGVSLVDSDGGWAKGTAVILVLRGEHPRWLDLPSGRLVFSEVLAAGGRVPVAPGHPPQQCSAVYCQVGAPA